MGFQKIIKLLKFDNQNKSYGHSNTSPREIMSVRNYACIYQCLLVLSENPFFVCVCVSELIRETLSLDDKISELAKQLCEKKSLIVMGRGFNFATCLEGALVSASSCYLF